ncbi:pirin family protein [Catenovulum agarivorans]|uniref:pirin family protein n=1 Tax=Catenovulum agarivorans TaxID=1172192 RepID=UPI00031BFC0B|nr:pirin family protein [Catenovulum agarivorans]
MRNIVEVIPARPTSDGAGVKLKRVFGGRGLERFDPFLMLDEFGSDESADYIAGFPPHPHRGFETITYMLNGKMEHQDHLGNVGLIEDGGVQWMRAGKGVIHSEMPKQTSGLLNGFQLWLNLPAKDKLTPAQYTDFPASHFSTTQVEGASVKALAGEFKLNNQTITGAISHPVTQPVIADISLVANSQHSLTLAAEYNLMLYVFEGVVEFSHSTQNVRVAASKLARFSAGDSIEFQVAENSRILLIAGLPLNEPVVQYGPFVMNTQHEINQAIIDYQNGVLTD